MQFRGRIIAEIREVTLRTAVPHANKIMGLVLADQPPVMLLIVGLVHTVTTTSTKQQEQLVIQDIQHNAKTDEITLVYSEGHFHTKTSSQWMVGRPDSVYRFQ